MGADFVDNLEQHFFFQIFVTRILAKGIIILALQLTSLWSQTCQQPTIDLFPHLQNKQLGLVGLGLLDSVHCKEWEGDHDGPQLIRTRVSRIL